MDATCENEPDSEWEGEDWDGHLAAPPRRKCKEGSSYTHGKRVITEWATNGEPTKSRVYYPWHEWMHNCRYDAWKTLYVDNLFGQRGSALGVSYWDGRSNATDEQREAIQKEMERNPISQLQSYIVTGEGDDLQLFFNVADEGQTPIWMFDNDRTTQSVNGIGVMGLPGWYKPSVRERNSDGYESRENGDPVWTHKGGGVWDGYYLPPNFDHYLSTRRENGATE